MKIFNGYMSERTLENLKDCIGKTLMSCHFAQATTDYKTMFECLTLNFECENLELSCSCDNYDDSQDAPGVYADLSVFVADKSKQVMPENAPKELEMIKLIIGKQLEKIIIFNEQVAMKSDDVEYNVQWLHNRGMVFCCGDKRLAVWKDEAYSDFLTVEFVDSKWQIPDSDDWESHDGKVYQVTSSITEIV